MLCILYYSIESLWPCLKFNPLGFDSICEKSFLDAIRLNAFFNGIASGLWRLKAAPPLFYSALFLTAKNKPLWPLFRASNHEKFSEHRACSRLEMLDIQINLNWKEYSLGFLLLQRIFYNWRDTYPYM